MTIRANFETPYYTLLNDTAYRLVKDITLYPEPGASYTDLTISIQTDNGLLYFEPVHITGLTATAPYTISDLQQYTAHSLAGALSEKCSTLVTIEATAGETVIAVLRQEVWIHPLDSFPGLRAAKFLARYITPHHPYVYDIKRKTAANLQQYGFHPAFDGYQSGDRQRVSDIIATLFYTLKDEQWVYSALPPGYEKEGQRIRMIDQVQRQRFGNCIDLSLVICACLEAMDLHPLLILIPGHAFVGCWLSNKRLDVPVTYYKSEIVNRMGKGNEEILVWEATAACAGHSDSFKEAVAAAERLIIGDKAFQLALDIRTSGLSGIIPFAHMQEQETSAALLLEKEDSREEFLTLNTLPPLDTGTSHNIPPASRQQVWERKLLDLTLRNSLLNLRLSNNAIQFVNVNFSRLLEALTAGKAFTLINTDALDICLEKRRMIDTLHETDGLFRYAAAEMEQHRLVSAYSAADLQDVLTHIMRNNVLAIDETGANSLYLTLGALKWYDTKTPETCRIAPLIMVPADLKRQSALSRFTLRLREEDIQVNTTLIAFLVQEFNLDLSGLITLSEDNETIDINRVFNTIRNAILPYKSWEVDELLFLSNFHFSTQVLWQDIRQNMPFLLQHPVIQSFVSQQYEADESLQLPEHTDTTNFETTEHIFPIDADSSQAEAIIAANMGKSFVLHGPPGTGKSQTITNIIANFLFHGKTVLFVAAKKAALDVVHKRLYDIGLDKFTLELHSNKSRKQQVLEHLESSLQQSKVLQDEAFLKAARNTAASRNEIEHIQKAMHQKQAAGLSVYELIEALTGTAAGQELKYHFPPELLLGLHARQLEQWMQYIRALADDPVFNTDYTAHPLAGLHTIHYYTGLEAFIAGIEPRQIQEIKNTLYNINNSFNNEQFNNISKIAGLLDISRVIRDNPAIPVKLMDPEFRYLYDDYVHLINLINSKQNIEKEIISKSDINIINLDTKTLSQEYKQALSQWFIPRFFNKSRIRKRLKPFIHPSLSDTGISELLEAANQYKNIQINLDNKHNKLLYNNIQKLTTKKHALDDLAAYKTIITELQDLAAGTGISSFIASRANELPSRADITDIFPPATWQALQLLEQQWNGLQPLLLQLDKTFVWSTPTRDLDDVAGAVTLLQQHIHRLHAWSSFRALLQQGNDLGLQKYLQYAATQQIKGDRLETDFRNSLYAELLQFYIRGNALLRNFRGLNTEKLMESYRLLQQNFTEYTKREVYTRLLQRLPDTQYAQVDHSELTVLQRAIKSKGRGISIRQLLQRTSNIMPRLSPCMLMSPISVAQYLDIGLPKFDLVIFDEASQLPTAEAVSAMARGRQVIIAGDPRQMPPTSFFTTRKTEEEYTDLEDMESILDDTLSIQVPSRYLLRHYRSAHESLITFSNRSFYNNSLFTFPSADDRTSRVQLIPVEGFYDKGRTRQNPAEAAAVVQEVLRRLRTPGLRHTTMGIVTFSQPQQSLIEDLLDQAFARYPELEDAARQLEAPVFIKNLENVQGDERDVILFSVGYGPDQAGRVSMNFGPLNRDGGWRRLNVAITRARKEMLVFSTLQPEMIDLDKTASRGVAALKGFLEYAAGRSGYREQANHGQDMLVREIGAFLASQQYEVVYDTGRSHFRIAIAVVHPGHPERFILGIIPDNRNYYDSGNINDRIIILPAVLRHLGWNLLHISAMDWHYHKQELQEHLLRHLAALLQPVEDPPLPAPPPEAYIFSPDNLQEAAVDTAFLASSSKRKVYETATLSGMQQSGADAMLAAANREIVKNQLLRITTQEAPLNLGVLLKKIAGLWHITRTGSRIERYIHELLRELGIPVTTFSGETFVWKGGYTGTGPEYYRTMPDQEKRQVTDLCPEEIFLCLHEALQHHIRLEKAQAFRYLQKTLMNTRYNAACNDYIEQAIETANHTAQTLFIASDHYKLN